VPRDAERALAGAQTRVRFQPPLGATARLPRACAARAAPIRVYAVAAAAALSPLARARARAARVKDTQLRGACAQHKPAEARRRRSCHNYTILLSGFIRLS
jgi:hypothetical protein